MRRMSDPLSPPDGVTRASAAAPPGESVGPYRLLHLVGEGGMGEVWLAEQMRPIYRQVALKIIKAGMDTAHVIARFEAERQAVALMAHPAIAQVFDAGATPQGRPFFAMEYVRGEPITTYCDRHRLTTRARIDLFLQVCDGVQHAHQKGIIHRDLKPSNILVTVVADRAAPKIIDFGVAKATTHTLTERTLYTEFGALVGTPEYMSPEQADASGLDVDTRTDVYALGVVFYELLTGALPFDARTLREKPLEEIRRTIREIDPPRPSTRVTRGEAEARPRAASNGVRPSASELRGDLDWITMRALEKDRTRRYGSASDLAADLRRHLDHLPVVASPPSAPYRLGKFVRRHRIGVAAAATLTVVVIAFAFAMAIQTRRIARERDRANQAAAAAKNVSEFLVGLFKGSDPRRSRGKALTAREILDNGARDLEQRLVDQPQSQARLEATVGDVYTSLGAYAAAESLLRKALDTQTRILGPNNPETLDMMNALANVYWFQGRYRDAEPLYRAALEGRRRVLGSNHRSTLRVAFDLASLYMQEKRWDESEQLQLQTLETQRRVLGDEDPDTLSSMNNLASYYWSRKRSAEAEPLYRKILELRQRLLGPDHPDTLLSMHNLASNENVVGHYAEAERLFIAALDAERRVLGPSHPQTAGTISALGRLYLKQKRYDEAEPLLLEAYRIDTGALGPDHSRTRELVTNLVELYDATKRLELAAEWKARVPKDPAAVQADVAR
jgi:eukaryotic-like serine/threonine-protein kinase